MKVGPLAARCRKYHMLTRPKPRSDRPAAQSREVIRRLKAEAQTARANLEDGLRLDWDDRWVHLRASNTEPVMRIIAEARTQREAQALVDEYTERVKKTLGE